MSYTISVAGDAPRVIELLSRVEQELDLGLIHCCEELDRSGAWPEGIFHLYLPYHSTRGVEVAREIGETSFRILTCCSREDYRMARALAAHTAQLVGADTIDTEGDGPVPAAELEQVLGDEWIDQMTHWGIGMMCAMLERDDDEHQQLQLFGWSRPFHFGRQTLARLRAQAGDDEAALTEAALAAIHRQQLIGTEHDEEDGAFAANVMQAVPQGADEDDPDAVVDFAIWGPGVWYLFPPCRYLALISVEEDGMPVFVPREAIHALLDPAMIEPLDEAYLRVDEVPESDWAALLERAAPHVVNPL